MPLRLEQFPVIAGASRVSFHDGFGDPRILSGLGHSAIDIGAPRGTPIVSATSGFVVREWIAKRNRTRLTGCGWSDRGGNIVVVIDEQGFAHYYAHMNAAPQVHAGQKINAGERLGEVGDSGELAERGPIHLHYQVWALGGARDAERATLMFVRPFGASVNPHAELTRLARDLGARVGGNGGVIFN